MLKFPLIICFLVLLSASIDARYNKRKGKLRPLEDEVESWTGKWFPHKPNETPTTRQPHKQIIGRCDDGKQLDIDGQSYKALCLASNRSIFEPNLNKSPVLLEHFIPPAYVPAVKCLNESIVYDEVLPTYGAFRPLPPRYGSYHFLPPQRWLHSLAEGAIVMLYHPCAFAGQVSTLENILKGCLYRHVITPSQELSPERPLALLSWGKCLQMSVVDDRIVVNFIKKNAKRGPIVKQNLVEDTKSYEAGLLSEARLVTDEEDIEICGYKEM